MKLVVWNLVIGALAAHGVATAEGWLARLLWLNTTLAFFGVGLTYWLNQPCLLAKQADGRVAWTGRAVFWPYHLFSRFTFWLVRSANAEPAFHEIVPGLLLGRRLIGARDAKRFADAGIRGVLDLTSEFTEPAFMRHAAAYRCLPVLDHRAPTPRQLDEAVAFFREHLPRGPVYVHCALGRGRSALAVAAWLIASGQFEFPADAFAFMRSRRPEICPNLKQQTALLEWLRARAAATS